jgi:hypothetical protein
VISPSFLLGVATPPDGQAGILSWVNWLSQMSRLRRSHWTIDHRNGFRCVLTVVLAAIACQPVGAAETAVSEELRLTAAIDRLQQTQADEAVAHRRAMQQQDAALRALESQRERQLQELASIRQQIAEATATLAADPLAEQTAALEAAEAAVVATYNQTLLQLSVAEERLVPGVVPPRGSGVQEAVGVDQATKQAVLSDSLDAVLRRWEMVLHAVGNFEVRVRSGIDANSGEEIAAHVLIGGGSVAWWVSLDGRQAGVVQASQSAQAQAQAAGDDGQLLLVPIPVAAPALRAALAQHAGQAPAAWLWLPVPANAAKSAQAGAAP